MLNTTNLDTLARKSLAAGRLAISAERIGSTDEATTAALACGRLAHAAQISTETLWMSLLCEGILDAAATWNAIVDAWYDADEVVN